MRTAIPLLKARGGGRIAAFDLPGEWPKQPADVVPLALFLARVPGARSDGAELQPDASPRLSARRDKASGGRPR